MCLRKIFGLVLFLFFLGTKSWAPTDPLASRGGDPRCLNTTAGLSSAPFGFAPDVQVAVANVPSLVEPATTELVQIIVENASQQGVTGPRLTSLQRSAQLVLTEVFTNAQRHGNRGDTNRRILVRYHMEGSRFRLEVADEGGSFHDLLNEQHPVNVGGLRVRTAEDQFDPEALHQRRSDAGMDLHRGGEGGRGVFLIQSFTDHLQFEPNRQGETTTGTRVFMEWDFSLARYRSRPAQ